MQSPWFLTFQFHLQFYLVIPKLNKTKINRSSVKVNIVTYDRRFVLLVRHVCRRLYCRMLSAMVNVFENVNENNVYSNVRFVDNDHVLDLDLCLDMIDQYDHHLDLSANVISIVVVMNHHHHQQFHDVGYYHRIDLNQIKWNHVDEVNFQWESTSWTTTATSTTRHCFQTDKTKRNLSSLFSSTIICPLF